MKTWIGVEVYQLIVQDVHVFDDFKKARAWFKEYTSVDYEVDDKGELPDFFYERLGEDYDQTKLFEVEGPEKEKFDLTKPGKYYWEIGIHGPGKNADDAWVQAVEGFINDVGEMDPNEIVDFEEEE